MNQTLETLNSRFSMAGALCFTEVGAGLPVADITTPHATARIAIQGAQVLAWQPTGQKPVIWVSKAAVYAPGKGVRGGVPVCWPWFGALPGQTMAHGFVRTRMWAVREAAIDSAQQVVLRLGLRDDASTRLVWDFAFDLELVVTVGERLTMALVTRNTGDAAFTITDALHTYFCVGDIAQTQVHGLDNTAYLDKLQDFAQVQQSGAVAFSAETDRVYIATCADCLIDDAALGRSLRVAKSGSASTVVWNPWSEREKAFVDMAAGEYRSMVCVETCNAGPDQISVAPGQTHTLAACISLG
jgi:glucose-6-phosphate 1-epimerase